MDLVTCLIELACIQHQRHWIMTTEFFDSVARWALKAVAVKVVDARKCMIILYQKTGLYLFLAKAFFLLY